MPYSDQIASIERHGFCLLAGAIDPATIALLRERCGESLAKTALEGNARSSRGHVYAARNLIETVPEVANVWRGGMLTDVLREVLGPRFGLVRVLFFDKPPDRSWGLAWHKDTAIAVRNNTLDSAHFTRPTLKSRVPHVIAGDDILRSMLTMRIHLDQVTDENGPLRVVPGSHLCKTCHGQGVEAAVAIHAEAGDVLAMRPLIDHSSGASMPGTTRHRRILHLEFAADPHLPDGYQWFHFIPGDSSQP